MLSQKGNAEKKQGMVAVAIDKDKGSQIALKWAVDNLLAKGKSVTFLHVASHGSSENDNTGKELFLPFRCFCTRKDIQVTEVVLEDSDIPGAICDYVKRNMIENLVVGSSVKNGFVRKFKNVDVPNGVTKGAPEFCNVYVISKGKVASMRSAKAQASCDATNPSNNLVKYYSSNGSRATSNLMEEDSIKLPFTRGVSVDRAHGDMTFSDFSDLSFVSSGRRSFDHMIGSDSDIMMPPRMSNSSDTDGRMSFGSPLSNPRLSDANNSFLGSLDSGNFSWSGSQSMDDVEAEIRRLKQELKQTMEMYSMACKEALSAKQKATELKRWKVEEEQRLETARLAEEAALAIAEKAKQKCKAAIERAEAAEKTAELEAQKRMHAEMKALQAAEDKKRVLDRLDHSDVRYRRYTIEEIEAATENFSDSRKIGEGGYGPVYKCNLDHTPVAVKVLHLDAAQGRSQFQQEIEVLSCIRHPNMVLLLGACPENGCLVYEYMANGSLDDRLFRRGNTSVLSWQLRFRIAAEIATGLLFLHKTKPEPLVHRDLKPGNILLDRYFVSKISDVGLARLVPPSVADSVTEYRMTSAAGTFCYIDPEYQQSGMLGIKSDVYSLGIMLLQIITAKPPMGLTHHVERAIAKGTFAEMLDPEVTDWPLEEALTFAKLAMTCAELRRRDRPDLGTVVLPELDRLRTLAEERMPAMSCY